MELKMNEYQLPEKISFNFEELKKELTEKVRHYETLVYTDDQIKLAKTDKAQLNKLKKVLNDERIRREREYMEPFNAFKKQINEIDGIIDKPVAVIDKQIKEYEDKQKQKKLVKIKELWSTMEVPEGLAFEKVFEERMLNVSFSIKHINQCFSDAIDRFNRDMETLRNLPKFGFEAVEVYKTTLDVNKAIEEGHRLSEMAKAKAEHEAELARVRAEKEAQKKKFPADVMNPPVVKDTDGGVYVQDADKQGWTKHDAPVEAPVEAPAKQWVAFQALMTTEDACALRVFFESRNIAFKPA